MDGALPNRRCLCDMGPLLGAITHSFPFGQSGSPSSHLVWDVPLPSVMAILQSLFYLTAVQSSMVDVQFTPGAKHSY